MNTPIKPLNTEKTTTLIEEREHYSFLVNPKLNKIQIKKNIEEVYGVTVEKVRTMNYSPIEKTKFTKKGVIKGKTAARKKALVQLKGDTTIDIYDTNI